MRWPKGATVHRLVTTTLLALMMTGLTASPALAHGRGTDASNFLSTITDAPGLDFLRWEVVNAGEYLRVTNTGNEEIVVNDYDGAPYLRIGPGGVDRNLNSQASYINEDRFGQTSVPDDIDVGGQPEWEHISDGSGYAWHDHRIHWMARANPPGVMTQPDRAQLVNQWSVPFVYDGQEFAVTGDLEWIPGGSPFPWLIIALVLTSLPVIYGLAASKPNTDTLRWRGLATPAPATLLVLALANLVHLIDDVAATPVPWAERATSAVQTGFFILIAVFSAVRALQGRDGAFTALGVGAGAVFIGQGLLYLSSLSASQTGSVFPGWVGRAVIAASLVQIIPLGVAAVLGTRALLPDFERDDLGETPDLRTHPQQ